MFRRTKSLDNDALRLAKELLFSLFLFPSSSRRSFRLRVEAPASRYDTQEVKREGKASKERGRTGQADDTTRSSLQHPPEGAHRQVSPRHQTSLSHCESLRPLANT